MAKEILTEDVDRIKELSIKVLGNADIDDIKRLGGLTNHTYKVTLQNGAQYVFRIPGEGTEELICREDERVSTKLACKLGIDSPMLYFGDNGEKVTLYIENARTMDAESLREDKAIVDVAHVFRRLHTCGENTGVPFEVFDMAKSYEDIIYSNNVSMFDDYEQVKEKIFRLKGEIDENGAVPTVPCHNDSLCENWVYSGDRLYLIDWEYAGMNDGMWDLADVSIEAGYSKENDELLLLSYFGQAPDELQRKRFIANKLYLDYLWSLWGKTRVPYDGDFMEQYALERYLRLKKNLQEI